MRGKPINRHVTSAPTLESLEPRSLLSVVFASSFVPVSALSSGYALLEADFDADGRADVLARISDSAGTRFELLLNRGENGRINFTRAPALPLDPQTANQAYATQLVAGRFDSDDTIDLLVIKPAGPASNGQRNIRVRLLKGDGDGGFRACRQSISDVALARNARFIGAAVDGPDARESVLAVSAGEIRSFKVGNTGKLAAERIVFQPSHVSISHEQVTDVNGDGRDDLVFYALDAERSGTHIFLAQGAGRFRYSGLLDATEDQTQSTVFTDADGDGRKELFSMIGADVVRRTITEASDGQLTFSMPDVVTSLPNPPLMYPIDHRGFRLRDVTDADHDGRLDLLTETIETTSDRMNPTYSTISLRLADGAGGFDAHPVASGYGYVGLVYSDWVLRDFDGDGVKDVFDASLRSVLRIVPETAVALPTIASLTVTDFNPVTGRRTINASGVSDPEGQVLQVVFYFDADGDGMLGTNDWFISTDHTADASGNWSRRLALDFQYGAPGIARFFAVATNSFGFSSAPVSVEITLP